MPNYWESRWGTRAAPIILEAAQGRGSVTLAGMNVFDVRHLYLIGLTLASEFEPFHCERCTNLLLRNVTARGICPQGYTTNCGVQEAIKMNQCQGVWVENVGKPWCGAVREHANRLLGMPPASTGSFDSHAPGLQSPTMRGTTASTALHARSGMMPLQLPLQLPLYRFRSPAPVWLRQRPNAECLAAPSASCLHAVWTHTGRQVPPQRVAGLPQGRVSILPGHRRGDIQRWHDRIRGRPGYRLRVHGGPVAAVRGLRHQGNLMYLEQQPLLLLRSRSAAKTHATNHARAAIPVPSVLAPCTAPPPPTPPHPSPLQFYNNVIHDIQGAGMGVWGCYDCLFAYNTLVRVGARSHTIEVKLGSRSCDGEGDRMRAGLQECQFLAEPRRATHVCHVPPRQPPSPPPPPPVGNATACSINYSAGGWGPTSPQRGGSDWAVNIPNRNVLIVNNLVFNPPPFNSQWQDIQVDGPTPSNSPPGRLPATVSADSGLVIR